MWKPAENNINDDGFYEDFNVEVAGSFIKILNGEVTDKYLGRLMAGNLKSRTDTEFAHCLQVAWAKCQKRKREKFEWNFDLGSLVAITRSN